MQEAINKAGALIEALSYIRQFRGRMVVVKLGGSLMETDQEQRGVMQDVAFMATVGMQPILVHGGGKAISAAMGQAGIEPQWVQGQRYTDERTLKIVEHVLTGINRQIVSTLVELGQDATGLNSLSSCVLFGEQMRLPGEGGRSLDVGLVGKITGVNGKLLKALCEAGTIPVITPIAIDRAGRKLNVNADLAAGMVAASVESEKLVMMSDTHGIFADPASRKERLSHLTEAQIEKLIGEGVIGGGMLPKVSACLQALEAGVGRAHIIDGSFPHALLLEIYTDDGVGTLISKN